MINYFYETMFGQHHILTVPRTMNDETKIAQSADVSDPMLNALVRVDPRVDMAITQFGDRMITIQEAAAFANFTPTEMRMLSISMIDGFDDAWIHLSPHITMLLGYPVMKDFRVEILEKQYINGVEWKEIASEDDPGIVKWTPDLNGMVIPSSGTTQNAEIPENTPIVKKTRDRGKARRRFAGMGKVVKMMFMRCRTAEGRSVCNYFIKLEGLLRFLRDYRSTMCMRQMERKQITMSEVAQQAVQDAQAQTETATQRAKEAENTAERERAASNEAKIRAYDATRSKEVAQAAAETARIAKEGAERQAAEEKRRCDEAELKAHQAEADRFIAEQLVDEERQKREVATRQAEEEKVRADLIVAKNAALEAMIKSLNECKTKWTRFGGEPVPLVRKQVFYIATSDGLAANNRFKIGGDEDTTKLVPRLRAYQSAHSTVDPFAYRFIRPCFCFRAAEVAVMALLHQFMDKTESKKEMMHIKYPFLLEVVMMVLDQQDAWVNAVNGSMARYRVSTVEDDAVIPPALDLVTLGYAEPPKPTRQSANAWTDEQKRAAIIRAIDTHFGAPFAFDLDKLGADRTIKWNDIATLLDEEYDDIKRVSCRNLAKELVVGTRITLECR